MKCAHFTCHQCMDARDAILADLKKLHLGADILALTDAEGAHAEKLLRMLIERYSNENRA